MGFVEPLYTKGRVDRAGESIKNGIYSPEDLFVMENWRSSHLYIMNTFQANLRRRRKNFPRQLTIAQRLKRKPTIVDKLIREPGMALSRMHDIAGCRLIFQNENDLREFRRQFHSARAKHALVGGADKYDYIERPKISGYRGVHDVYRYKSIAEQSERWDDLRIELQYRTIHQHAWATAVEVNDLSSGARLKFGEGAETSRRFFVLASELIARHFENQSGPLPESRNEDIIDELLDLEAQIKIMARMRNLVVTDPKNSFKGKKIFIIINSLDYHNIEKEYLFAYSEYRTAIKAYERFEERYAGLADVVLVGANEIEAVKLAYTNYFSDASIFLEFIQDAIKNLSFTPLTPPSQAA